MKTSILDHLARLIPAEPQKRAGYRPPTASSGPARPAPGPTDPHQVLAAYGQRPDSPRGG